MNEKYQIRSELSLRDILFSRCRRCIGLLCKVWSRCSMILVYTLCGALLSLFIGCANYTSNQEQLFHACQNGNLSIVKKLHESGVSLNFRYIQGRTPLYQASLYNHYDVVFYLLQQGADPFIGVSWKSNRLPLHAASQFGSPELVQLFLDKGVDVNTRDDARNTPLHSACYYLNTNVVAYLVSKGADVNSTNKIGTPPILNFSYQMEDGDFNRYRIILNILADYGANVNYIQHDGFQSVTPLAFAVYIGDIEAVKLLINKGANTNVRTRMTQEGTLLSIARQNNHSHIIAYLSDLHSAGSDN